MFTPADRDDLRARVLRLADEDERVVAGAVVGSLAFSEGDRWSDLDLTFAVVEGLPITEVLEDWTRTLAQEFQVTRLFDLPVGASIYRVFVTPGGLQFDLSFSPADQFGAQGPEFRLLFGSAVERAFPTPPSARELLGLAVHHALRARFSIERGRRWQGEYWVSEVRDLALGLACLRSNLPTRNGRGFDRLPQDLLRRAEDALPTSLAQQELLRALAAAVELLLTQATEVGPMADEVEPVLRELIRPWDD